MRNLLALLLLAPCALLAQVPDYVPTDGLVAWYPFNGNANDESGISADGQVFSATLTEDRFGNAASAYYFSGSGCTPHIETNIDFQGSDEGMSISFWLNRAGNGCIYPRLFGFWSGSNSPQSWGMAWGNSAVLDYMGTIPSNNEWHHVAVSLTSDSIQAYLNGELMGSVASGKQPPLASFMSIGRMTHPAYDAFNGSMDDFAVYNRAITPEEISQLYGASIAPALPSYIPADGLIAYYPLDGDGQDIGPLGLDGITLGTECGADRFADSCGAVTFTDGDRIQAEPDSNFTSQQLSSSFWLRLESYDGYNHFLNRWSGSVHEFVFSANTTGLYLYVENESFQSDFLPPLHEWHHMTFWYDAVAGTAGIYMDGDPVANFTGIDPVNPSGLPLCIGGTTNPGAYNSVNGEMDDLAIWNRVLTAEEIVAVYEAGLPSPTAAAGVFDGDDHIWLTDADFLNFGQSSFTAHVQFRPTDLSNLVECCGYQTLIAKGSAGGTGEKGFNLDLRGEPGDARIKCRLSSAPGVDVILNAPIVEDDWYDLVFVVDWDAEWASLFLNGALIDEGSLASLGNMNNGWYPSIGRYVWNNSNSYNGHFFKGEMSWLRILNEADYELGQFPCAWRDTTVLELTDFTAEEVAAQVNSTFSIDEVIDVINPCGGFSATYGCADPTACNYSEEADLNDGSCIPSGCTDATACNYSPEAGCDNGNCDYSCCPGPGCCGEGMAWSDSLQHCVITEAIIDSIFVPIPSCGPGTVWDPVAEECIVAVPTDNNFDGCITAGDVLNLLATFGTCPPIPEWPDTTSDTTGTSWMCGDPLPYQGYDYATVQIGDQCWFAENLQSLFYSDGSLIQTDLDDSIWASTNDGAVTTYGTGSSQCFSGSPDFEACDDAESLSAYGRLYNWHAVLDSRNICPINWHVSSDEDWFSLEEFLGLNGYSGAEGLSLKSESGWANGGNGPDQFGFTALPGGVRNGGGIFDSVGISGIWWTSTPVQAGGWRRDIYYSSNNLIRLGYPDGVSPQGGFSIRCVKD